MRALFVSHTPPQPGFTSGRERRSRLFVAGIEQVCAQVDFVHFVPPGFFAENRHIGYSTQQVWGVEGNTTFCQVRQRTETIFNHYLAGIVSVDQEKTFFPISGPEQMAAVRIALEARPDLIFVDEIRAMQPVLAAKPTAPILFDLNDLVHRVHWRMALAAPHRPGKLAYAAQVPAILAAERTAVRAAARSVVCSESDRAFIAKLGAGDRAMMIPNAISLPAVPPGATSCPTLLFLGTYSYEPNVLAAQRLIRSIWPRVLRQRPDARLLIAGPGMERLTDSRVKTDDIDYLGFVDNLNDLYARSRVVCCPITVGGGTRIKLIEAAAHARPMVSTRVGAEGLAFRDGMEIIIRDSDEAFADACVTLLADQAACSMLGNAARILALERYDATAIQNLIKQTVHAIMC